MIIAAIVVGSLIGLWGLYRGWSVYHWRESSKVWLKNRL